MWNYDRRRDHVEKIVTRLWYPKWSSLNHIWTKKSPFKSKTCYRFNQCSLNMFLQKFRLCCLLSQLSNWFLLNVVGAIDQLMSYQFVTGLSKFQSKLTKLITLIVLFLMIVQKQSLLYSVLCNEFIVCERIRIMLLTGLLYGWCILFIWMM